MGVGGWLLGAPLHSFAVGTLGLFFFFFKVVSLLQDWLLSLSSPFLLSPTPSTPLSRQISWPSFQPGVGGPDLSFPKPPPIFENRQQAVSDYFKNPDHLGGEGG